MMKKLLVLTLVLGMASLASAGFVITSDLAELDPVASPTAILTISSDADMTPFEAHTLALIVNTDAATITGGVALPIENLVSGVQGALNDTILNPEGTDGIWMTTLWASFAGNLTASDIFGDIVLTCIAPDVDAVVSLYEIEEGVPFGDAIASITIKQIPEPMTMALLGLGGLFLRRRK